MGSSGQIFMSTDAPHLLAASSKQVALTPNMDDVHSPEAPVSVDVLSRTLTAKQFVNFLSEYVNTYWHKEFHLSEPCFVEHHEENN